ncbi:MAG: glycosyl hydrolase, partial [Rariglobus sp.]
MKTPRHPALLRVIHGILSGLSALLVSTPPLLQAQPTWPENQPAPGYSAPPPIISIGGATVAAYSPPHEQLENPASDANDINDNNTFQNLTRPIFLTPEQLDSGGDPIRPVATTDWWSHLLMNGDNGQLWQYPITSKFIAAGIEIQQILGPKPASKPGELVTGYATGGVLKIEGVEKASASATPDIILADFEVGALPAGWTGTGSFSSSNPTVVQFVPPAGTPPTYSGSAPTGYIGSRFLLSKNPAESSIGDITSSSFAVNRSYLHFLMGGGSNAALRIEILNASTNAVLASTQRVGSSSAAMSWTRLDLAAYNGQSVKLRVVDQVTSGWAWLAVDQFVLSNDPLSPAARPGSRLISGAPAKAGDWSDWMVKVRKTDGVNSTMSMDFNLVRNMPFVWVQLNNLNPRISFGTTATVLLRDGSGSTLTGSNLGTHERIGVEVDGQFYGLHVAAGTTFAYDAAARQLTATLPAAAGQNYIVVSAMRSAGQLALFDSYAYARPEKTTVSYTYNPAAVTGGAVQTTWNYQITALKPGAQKVLQGWLPPHYRETGAALALQSGLDYPTPRGVLRCGEANATAGFSIKFAFNGILGNFAKPTVRGLPNDFDAAYMEQLLRSYDNTNNGEAGDTYYGAKNLVKHARAMHMAKDLGLTDVYDNLKAELIVSLSDWFNYDGVEENHYFARNDRWGHLIGHNFVPDFNLAGFTDVHFHYGYYVLAYALLASEDAAFRDQYKEIAIHLARDYANWERNATDYPWMRTFEPMVGHSYAGGSSSGGGNNQESSSESIQAWAGMFLLGEVLRGNDPRAADILATAAFGYAIETRAVYEYYCDYHGSPFAAAPKDLNGQPAVGATRHGNWPDGFRYGKYADGYANKPAWVFSNGIMSDNGNSFSNYFSGEPAHTYGIQWLPNAPHMMFLARDPAFIRGQFDTLFKYRGEHFAIANLNPLASSMKNLRSKWHSAPTSSVPDPRVVALNEGWPTYGIKWAIQALYELNPAFVRNISNEGDPARDNPLYNQATGTWLVTLPAADTPTSKITFPPAIWNPDALVANNPHLVPPSIEAGLTGYALAKWVAAFHTAGGGPGPDWARYKQYYSWDPADYTARDSQESITGLLAAMQDIGGNSWPLIALCYDGFAEPDFGLKVMAEYRRRNLSYANDTESNMFFYYYLSALNGLGTLQTDQHLSTGTSAVFRDTAGNRNYMVQNKDDAYRLVDVYQAGAKIGQVLAYPKTTTLQKGLLDVAAGFAPIGTVPAKNSTGVSVNQDRVVVIFNEAFNAATIDNEVT